MNYIPSYAVNQLEMWQAETWDPARIDQELLWAESVGARPTATPPPPPRRRPIRHGAAAAAQG